jgi:hypothetical protein
VFGWVGAAAMISYLWEPIRKYIEELNSSGSMSGMHHYTTASGALAILGSGRMWFTERAHLNDSCEILLGIETAKAILCGLGRKEDALNIDGSAKKVFCDFRFFSASFSRRFDDPSQWYNYADDGKGVALSFKASAFSNPKAYVDEFIKEDSTALVCPMAYDQVMLQSIILRIIERWDRVNIGELCDHLFMISSMFKGDRWKSEKEFRFFIHQKRDKILKNAFFRTRVKKGKTICYLDLPIQNWCSVADFPIYRICLGPAAPDGFDAKLRGFISSNGIPIRQEDVVTSSLPYPSV